MDKCFELFGKMVIISHNIDDLNNEMGKLINKYGRILQDNPDEFLLGENCDNAYAMKSKILLMTKEMADMENVLSEILELKE